LPVPSCPGWTVEKLARHVAGLDRWVAALVDAAPEPVDQRSLPVPPKGPELRGFLADATERVTSALAGIDPNAPVTTWAGVQPARWWARRLAHEIAVHRWDAQDAAGDAEPIEAALAVDGIDELLEVFLPLTYDASAFAPGAPTVHLHCTDAEGEWLLRLGEPLEVTREHAKGDVAARGAASDLLLVLWKRLPADRVDTFGDPELFRRFLSYSSM